MQTGRSYKVEVFDRDYILSGREITVTETLKKDGTVMRARFEEKGVKADYIVKLLTEELSGNLRNISSPYIVRDVGRITDEGRQYIVYEGLTGDLLSLDRLLSDSERALVFISVLRALRELVRRGYYYSDLKFENVVVMIENGAVTCARLCDFDAFVTAIDSTAKIGTRGASAPDLYIGRNNTVNIVMYQLGTFLYKLCSGRPFFNSKYISELESIRASSASAAEKEQSVKKYYSNSGSDRSRLFTTNRKYIDPDMYEIVCRCMEHHTDCTGVLAALNETEKLFYAYLDKNALRIPLPSPSGESALRVNSGEYKLVCVMCEETNAPDIISTGKRLSQNIRLEKDQTADVPLSVFGSSKWLRELTGEAGAKRGPLRTRLFLTRSGEDVYYYLAKHESGRPYPVPELLRPNSPTELTLGDMRITVVLV